MLARVMLCGMVLLVSLWIEEAQAGSSFLSPADLQKNLGKRPIKKMLNTNVHRRGAEEDDAEEITFNQLIEDQGEIGIKLPLDINVKMTEEQKEAIEEMMFGIQTVGAYQRADERDD
uniref:Uncharacterized protein n=1 Tax=Leptobrachium leishanense TaxID=445787 RepID=A0A8C5WGD7_9ANUR